MDQEGCTSSEFQDSDKKITGNVIVCRRMIYVNVIKRSLDFSMVFFVMKMPSEVDRFLRNPNIANAAIICIFQPFNNDFV